MDLLFKEYIKFIINLQIKMKSNRIIDKIKWDIKFNSKIVIYIYIF